MMPRASRRSKPPDLDLCPTPSSLHWFCGTTDKSKSAWFWCTNQETFTVVLMHKSPNRSCQFWDPNQKTWATGFETKSKKTEYPTCATIPGPLHQISYSCHDPCRCPSWRTCHLHTTRQANMILLMKQRIKVKLSKCPRFEFKPHQVNDSSQSNQGIDHLISQFDSIHDAHFFCLLSFSFWYDNNFDRRGHKRLVNAILGNLLWLYFPGVVVTGVGRSVPITSWRDYALTPDVRYKNAQGVMRNAFYVSSYIFITSITSYNI
jgi:hypothetical protein